MSFFFQRTNITRNSIPSESIQESQNGYTRWVKIPYDHVYSFCRAIRHSSKSPLRGIISSSKLRNWLIHRIAFDVFISSSQRGVTPKSGSCSLIGFANSFSVIFWVWIRSVPSIFSKCSHIQPLRKNSTRAAKGGEWWLRMAKGGSWQIFEER